VGEELALNLAATVALYTVARHGSRKAGLVAASVGAVVVSLGSAVLGDEPFFVELLSELAQGFLPIAVGDAVRTRADRVRELIDAEADARVQAERLRIARDLHDVVAHGLSTIAVQSGVAAHLLDRDPEHARQALETINATGKTSLEELRVMVGVLRSSDDAPLRPTPTDPNDISELLTGAANAGITVTHTVEGRFPDDASDAAAVAFHRIVQEALTNVARHSGTASATLQVQHQDDLVELVVRNTGPRSTPTTSGSTGVGIVGMRERAESLGGSLHAAPTEDGGFQVVATIPYVRHAS
jgi:signal transduction histidine kinase